MLERIEGNGVHTIIVETANRFAHDLMGAGSWYAKLRERGILDDGPTAKLVRRTGGHGT